MKFLVMFFLILNCMRGAHAVAAGQEANGGDVCGPTVKKVIKELERLTIENKIKRYIKDEKKYDLSKRRMTAGYSVVSSFCTNKAVIKGPSERVCKLVDEENELAYYLNDRGLTNEFIEKDKPIIICSAERVIRDINNAQKHGNVHYALADFLEINRALEISVAIVNDLAEETTSLKKITEEQKYRLVQNEKESSTYNDSYELTEQIVDYVKQAEEQGEQGE